ncbi:DUF1326 domain-containing protein [Pseudonocardia sp.]|uniref:DUF1326 domain-containing protein n=1 Tax=Pseudonocardia sp. TaxID=60912 RepID=UPI003D0C8111
MINHAFGYEEVVEMGWNLDGVWTESCTCSITCPCNLNEDPTYGNCDVAFCFHITSGQVDGVDVGGIPVVWTVNLPGAFTAGNAMARLYIHDGASQEQREALEPIFHGKRGGVWEVLAGIVKEWLETKYAPITVEDGETTRTVTVGDFGQIVAEPVVDHRGEKALLMEPPLLTPLSVQRFEISRGAGTEWRDPDMKAWSGVHAGRTKFTWSSEPPATDEAGMAAAAV